MICHQRASVPSGFTMRICSSSCEGVCPRVASAKSINTTAIPTASLVQKRACATPKSESVAAPSVLPRTTKTAAAITCESTMSMPKDSARRVAEANCPRRRACRATTRGSGSARITGPHAQKPTMAPKVFVIKSSTSNRRYGCS